MLIKYHSSTSCGWTSISMWLGCAIIRRFLLSLYLQTVVLGSRLLCFVLLPVPIACLRSYLSRNFPYRPTLHLSFVTFMKLIQTLSLSLPEVCKLIIVKNCFVEDIRVQLFSTLETWGSGLYQMAQNNNLSKKKSGIEW